MGGSLWIYDEACTRSFRGGGGERRMKRCLSARRDERTDSEQKETGTVRDDREHWGSRWERARRDEAGRGKFPLQSGRSCAADSAPRSQTVCAAAAAAVLFRCRKFLLGLFARATSASPVFLVLDGAGAGVQLACVLSPQPLVVACFGFAVQSLAVAPATVASNPSHPTNIYSINSTCRFTDHFAKDVPLCRAWNYLGYCPETNSRYT